MFQVAGSCGRGSRAIAVLLTIVTFQFAFASPPSSSATDISNITTVNDVKTFLLDHFHLFEKQCVCPQVPSPPPPSISTPAPPPTVNVTFDIDNYTGPIDTLDSDLQSYFADQLGLPRSQVEVISSYAELGRRLAVKSARLFVEVRMFEVQRQQEQLVAAVASYPALEREVGLIGGVVVADSIIIRTADVIPPSPPTALHVYLSAESGLRSCLLSSSNNELQCGSTYNSDSLLHPGGLALSPDGQTAYVIDDSEAPGVTVCPISNGSFSCSSMTGINLYNPKAIAVSPDGLYAYITDAASGNVTICTINGSSLTCGQQKGGFNQPWGIALSPDGKTAFITDSSAISYTSCSVSGSTLDTCMMKPLITTDVNQQGEPQGIALSPDGKTAFIAMSQGTAGINVCNVTDTTIFCTSPAVNPDCLFTNPQYVALTKDGSKLAVTTSNGNGTVVVCDVNNQAIDNCNANQITWPQGVAAF